jgi:hypothetical protein
MYDSMALLDEAVLLNEGVNFNAIKNFIKNKGQLIMDFPNKLEDTLKKKKLGQSDIKRYSPKGYKDLQDGVKALAAGNEKIAGNLLTRGIKRTVNEVKEALSALRDTTLEDKIDLWLMLVIVSTINTFSIAFFSVTLGPVMGAMLGAGVVAPIVEELSKKIAEDNFNLGKEFGAVVGLTELLQYPLNAAAMGIRGFKLLFIILHRATVGLAFHTSLTATTYSKSKYTKNEDTDKNLLIGIAFHMLNNIGAVALRDTLAGSLVYVSGLALTKSTFVDK